MPNETFHLTTLTRVLGDDTELAEALGFLEISALDEVERGWRKALQTKAKGVLEDNALSPAISLHRRHIAANVELGTVNIAFEPPQRSPEWQEPVNVTVHFAQWSEHEMHHAFAPALGIHVFASRASLLPERIEQHVRLVLSGQRKQLTFAQLVDLARVQELKLGQIEVTARRKTPTQIAAAEEGSEEKQSILAKLAQELPPPIREGATQVIGIPQVAFEMETELQNLAETLGGRRGGSVLLVGSPGCGKTALVRELARRRKDFSFAQTPFWATSGARLMMGQAGFGMWQERCQKFCREAAKTNAVVHLGNLAELVEVGKATRGQQSVGGFLRPWIARGDVLAIVECAPEQLAAIEHQDSQLLSVFRQVIIPERSTEQTRAILGRVFDDGQGKAPVRPEVVKAALNRISQLHARYATYSANPGRPLRFLKNLLADRLPDKSIAEPDATAAFSRETGLPLMLLDDAIPLDLVQTRAWFGQRVIGQPEAVNRVVDLLTMVKARLARPHKPLASFLFIGPTGTGKTEMAKSLAEYLFGDPGRMVRFDLNEFSNPASVQRLIGGSSGGSAEGLLTARVREQPFSVLLLDEFEKADPSFFDLLLQILGDGRLTDASGRVADFCNSVVVMTSNLGVRQFQRGPSGFRSADRDLLDVHDHFSEAVRKFLRPEIFNRLDAVVPFNALTPDVVLAIARRHLEMVRQRDGLLLRPVEFEIRPEVAGYLATRGYDVRYGARPLKRAIERELLAPLSEALNSYQKETPLRATVGLAGGGIHIEMRARQEEAKALRPTPSAAAATEAAEAIVRLRRTTGRLRHGTAAGKIEDEVTLLESLERRLAKTKWKNPDFQARLARLPTLRELLMTMDELFANACHLETESLASLYLREGFDGARLGAEMEVIEQKRRRLAREVFCAQIGPAENVVMSFFSEDRETLLEFASAYWQLGKEHGQALTLDYFVPPPGGRTRHSSVLRETPKRLDTFFFAPPANIIGVVMHLRGNLFLPRFQAESGLHVVREKKGEYHCLVETGRLPFADYTAPRNIDRKGAIKEKGAPLCRQFEREKGLVKDAILGERPWKDSGIARCVTVLTEERLEKAIAAMTT